MLCLKDCQATSCQRVFVFVHWSYMLSLHTPTQNIFALRPGQAYWPGSSTVGTAKKGNHHGPAAWLKRTKVLIAVHHPGNKDHGCATCAVNMFLAHPPSPGSRAGNVAFKC